MTRIRGFRSLALLLVAIFFGVVLVATAPVRHALATLSGQPQLVDANIAFSGEVQPFVYDYRATDSQTSTHLLVSFEGTAEYTVNGGSAIALTSGVTSAAIDLGTGTALSDRVTKIVITVNGNTANSYLLRVFRMPVLTSVALRDKSGNTIAHTETQTGDFAFKEEASIGHSISQLEFRITGAGWFHGWFGHGEIATMDWRDLNWSACCLFRDGLNNEVFNNYPFRGLASLNGIGWGPGIEYTFAITRAPAFGSNTISSITIPALGATCASTATECQEVSSAPGTFDVRALDSTSSITLNATFTSGTASYSVNGGASQALTSGTASNTVSLGSGTSLSSRVTTITVTHNGAFTSTYVLRVFRMPVLTSVALRDKSGNTIAHTETQTGDFAFKEEASIGHSISQLEFRITGAGWFHGWFGHGEIATMDWRDLNWSACCLFRDGLNNEVFNNYPFRGLASLNGIGWGPGIEYTFAITRAPAFGSNTISSITIPALGATCASTATECQEVSSAPGTFDVRALDSTSSITLNATFTSGTASYSVNGGASQALTSGTASNTVSLGSGTSLSSRVTTITVTHNGAFTSTYVLRVFRMPVLTSVALRDKSGNTIAHTETQTGDFAFKEEASIGHSISQLEFRITGAGWFHGWFGHGEIATMDWRDLNWSACCLFRDGLNNEVFNNYPFRGLASLNGIGWGPGIEYTFAITRAPAFTAPTNNSPPSINGSATIGSTLTATTGSWSGSNHSFTYTWKRSSSANGSYTTVGTNASTYEIDGSDAGKYLKVEVVATANGLSSTPASSSAILVPVPSTTTVVQSTTTVLAPSTTTQTPPNTTGTSSGGGSGPAIGGETTESTPPTTATNESTPPTSAPSPETTPAPTTTTPEPPEATTTTVVDPNAPEVPDVDTGSAVATIDGRPVEVEVSRDGNTLVIQAGEIVWELDAMAPDGSPIALDAEGNLTLKPGDSVGIDLAGFGPGTPVEVWLFSIPVKVDDLTSDSAGRSTGSFPTPQGIDPGAHRVVVKGSSPDGNEVIVAFGIAVNSTGGSGGSMSILLTLAGSLVLLALVGLLGWLRRRPRETT